METYFITISKTEVDGLCHVANVKDKPLSVAE